MSTLLRVDGIEVGYGDLTAVRDVSLEVREGEAVALIGANGAGKTTTLRAVSGLLPLRRGRIEFEGQRLDGLGPAEIVARGIAHVPEGRQLFPTMTVRENLELGARTRAARAARSETLARVFDLFPRLRERGAQLAGTLSGGALVGDYQDALKRETLLLARDPTVIEGTAKGDWATLARGASPRVLAVTQDGIADFIAIRDGRGAPLVQVPAGPPPSLPGMPASSEPITALRLAGGRPYFLVVAPISGATERAPFGATGTVVAGRRLDGLAASLDRLPARPAVLFLAGDRALATSRPDLPATGWTPAVGSGIAMVAGEPWSLRRLESLAEASPDG